MLGRKTYCQENLSRLGCDLPLSPNARPPPQLHRPQSTMAKRKRGGPKASTAPPSEYADRRANKLAVNSYQDVADSEDEFMAHRDKVLLDEGPDAKRRKHIEAEAMEHSDEEVLGFDEDSDLDEDEDEEGGVDFGDDDDDGGPVRSEDEGSGAGSEEDEDIRDWGDKKADYYNADAIETEQDALDEEAEARRIQQKQRKALNEADYGFDADEWAAEGKEDDETNRMRGGVVTEQLPQLEVTEGMSAAEKLKLLKQRYPEFEPLSQEFVRLQPVYEELAEQTARMKDVQQGASSNVGSVAVLQYRALSGYMGALAMYFALLTSTASMPNGNGLPMPANELRDHDVITSLEQYRQLWSAVEPLEAGDEPSALLNGEVVDGMGGEVSDEGALDDFLSSADDEEEAPPLRTVKKQKENAAKAASDARRAARLARTEASLAQLNDLTSRAGKIQPTASRRSKPTEDNSASDLGDEQPLTAREAAEKAKKRKSLRFYTSQIAQKANKRANAGRAAGGDDDVPHRERLRDRQERLNREAVKRGQKGGKGGEEVELDGSAEGSGEEDVTNREREEFDEDAGESALLARAHAKKASKKALEAAYAQAKAEGGRVVPMPQDSIGPDGRREIGYKIEKNKGLTPKRKKEVKNPRVKKRKKYEDKSKKLRSMKPTFKGGEGKGGYGGELTGIKRNLVRSTKL